MSTGADALLDRADGTLDFADVAVGGNEVEVHGLERVAHTGEYLVGMDVDNVETAVCVKADHGGEKLLLDGLKFAVGDRADGAEHEVAGDSVKETVTLNVKKIDAKDHVAIVFQNVCRERNRKESGHNVGKEIHESSCL